MKKFLIIDASNIIHRVFRAHIKDKEDILLGMCIHSFMHVLSKYYYSHHPDDIVVAFDSEKSSWRKKYTLSKEAKTYKQYKGNRRKNLTESELKKYEALDKLILDIKNILKTQTSLLVIEGEELEADDMIAGFVQLQEDHKCIIVSADNDFIQLMRNPNVTLINPIDDKPMSLKEWDFNADYFMFEKCIRGDAGDNVMSSYPRLRSNKIKEAFYDEFKKQNIMNHEFLVEYLDDDGKLISKKYKTSIIFEENQLLMNLQMQPKYIKKKIYESIYTCMEKRGTFSIFKFLKFCGKYDLKSVGKNINKFIPVLAIKTH
jgi:hypothetical protein